MSTSLLCPVQQRAAACGGGTSRWTENSSRSWTWFSTLVSTTTVSLGNTTDWITPERPLGYYLFEIYTPAVFIVIMSWFNFWLNR